MLTPRQAFAACLSGPWNYSPMGLGYRVEGLDDEVRVVFEYTHDKQGWEYDFDVVVEPYKDMPVRWLAHKGFVDLWKSARKDVMGIGVGRIATTYAFEVQGDSYATGALRCGGNVYPGNAASYLAGNATGIGVGRAATTYAFEVQGDSYATGSLRSAVATGTAPLFVASTTVVTNLNASFVNGLSLSVGSAGVFAVASISNGASWTIPAGTYVVASTPSNYSAFQINSGSGWQGNVGFGGGTIISDGTNFIITAVGGNLTISYRKLA